MGKLFDEAYQVSYKEDHICSSWEDFKRTKPYHGNATCPINIIAWSWFREDDSDNESENKNEDHQNKDNSDNESDNESDNKNINPQNEDYPNEWLYLVCKYWSSCCNHFPTYIFKINVKRRNEPAIRKFIEKHMYTVELP